MLDVRVKGMVNLSRDYSTVDRIYHYEGGVGRAQADGIFSAEEADRLVAAMRAAGVAGEFLCATTFFITGATKP